MFRHPAGGGIPLRWPSSSSRCSPWRGGSSSPSGLRVCTSSYVFGLSLSCSWDDTILMYRELCYYIRILWCFFPPLLSCNELSFPFEVILSDWVFKDLRTLDVCLVVRICGDNGISRDSLDVCFGDQLAGSAHEPMHRGWHTFSSWFSGRNFGALFEVLCVGWIDESEIVWCISYNHTHGYLRWHWSI